MDKTTIVACAAGVAITIGAIVGFSIWNSREKWDSEIAAAEILELTDLYNEAISQHPADSNKAIFWFDLATSKKRAEFLKQYDKFEESVEWANDFDTQCANLRKALRKG